MFGLLVFLETNPSLRERIIAQIPEPSPPPPVEPEQADHESPPPREASPEERQSAPQQADRAPAETVPPPAPAPVGEASTGSTQKGSSATETEPHEGAKASSALAITEADQLLRRGDVAGARLWLSSAADRGDAEAVFRLAETYDPRILRQWGVVGLQGDPGKARELYAKASEAGYRAAQERLAHVGE